MIGTVWLDHAYDRHFVIVKANEDDKAIAIDGSRVWLDVDSWCVLMLDGTKAGELRMVYDFELKHGRFKKVG